LSESAGTPDTQRFDIAIGAAGYEPSAVTAEAGKPIALNVAQGEGCAAGFVISELGVNADNTVGPVTVDLGVVAPGEYRYACGMDMLSGTLVVR